MLTENSFFPVVVHVVENTLCVWGDPPLQWPDRQEGQEGNLEKTVRELQQQLGEVAGLRSKLEQNVDRVGQLEREIAKLRAIVDKLVPQIYGLQSKLVHITSPQVTPSPPPHTLSLSLSLTLYLSFSHAHTHTHTLKYKNTCNTHSLTRLPTETSEGSGREWETGRRRGRPC